MPTTRGGACALTTWVRLVATLSHCFLSTATSVRCSLRPGGARSSPPEWAILVGKLVVGGALVGLGVLVKGAVGRILMGAGIGVGMAIVFPLPGFAIGAGLGGALGSAFGKDQDAVFGGALIGGWAVVLLRLAFEWLAKTAADAMRYTRY